MASDLLDLRIEPCPHPTFILVGFRKEIGPEAWKIAFDVEDVNLDRDPDDKYYIVYTPVTDNGVEKLEIVGWYVSKPEGKRIRMISRGVRPKWQGRGIAEQMLNMAAEKIFAEESEVNEVTILIYDSNKRHQAHMARLAQRLGPVFVPSGHVWYPAPGLRFFSRLRGAEQVLAPSCHLTMRLEDGKIHVLPNGDPCVHVVESVHPA